MRPDRQAVFAPKLWTVLGKGYRGEDFRHDAVAGFGAARTAHDRLLRPPGQTGRAGAHPSASGRRESPGLRHQARCRPAQALAEPLAGTAQGVEIQPR